MKHLFLIVHYKDTLYRWPLFSTKVTCTMDELDKHVESTKPPKTQRSSWTVQATNVK